MCGSYYPDVKSIPSCEQAGIDPLPDRGPGALVHPGGGGRFHEALLQHTGDPDISTQGRAVCGVIPGLGAAKQYILGLMTPAIIYQFMEKNYPLLSRGASISATKTAPQR